ncbi:hypothetical protein FRC00_013759 [Tulasnella sp. 408]|nr:hypothetical protein FRC00_013759 [Tulasnella sp. 408]
MTTKFASDEDLLEEWRERLVDFRIDPNQLAYADKRKAVTTGAVGRVRKANFTPPAVNQLEALSLAITSNQPTTTVVAVKGLKIHLGADSDRFEKRFISETYMWSQLKHDRILGLTGFHFSSSDGDVEAMVVCPWLENGHSVRYVDKRNLSSDKRLYLLLDAAEGLHYLHTHQPPICHGNIKGSNLLIKNDGRATICDFGLAQALDEDFAEITGQTTYRGNIRWASPERLNSNGALAPPNDVWSWAWLIWELMTGKAPFHLIKNSSSLIYHIVTSKLPACEEEAGIREVPALARLMRMCWQQEPESRLKINECINFLNRIISEVEPQDVPETQSEPGDPALSVDFSKLPLTYSPVPQVIHATAFSLDENFVVESNDGKSQPTPIPSPPQDRRSLSSSSPAQPRTLPQPALLTREASIHTINSKKDLPPLPPSPVKSPIKTVEAVFPEEHPQPYVFKLENSPPLARASRRERDSRTSRPDPRMSLEAAHGTESITSSPRGGSSLPGLLGITKSLFRTSKRQKRSSEAPVVHFFHVPGQDYDYNPWDLLDVPRSNMNSPSSATNGSEPGTSDSDDIQGEGLQRTLKRIEATQARYLQEQLEIKQYLSQMGQWLSQAPLFRAPAPPLPASATRPPVMSPVLSPILSPPPLVPPMAKPVPSTPSAVASDSSIRRGFSSHIVIGSERQSWPNPPAGGPQPAHGRPKEYNSVNLAAMALRDAMVSDDSIPKAGGSTSGGSRSPQSSVQSSPLHRPRDMNNTKTLPRASSDGHENRLIKEEEIQVYEVVTPGAKTKALKGVIVATGQVVAIKCLGFQIDPKTGDKGRDMTNLSAWMERWVSCEHSNVAKLVGRTVLDSSPAIVSEWHSGGNIADYLKDNPHADRKSLLRQVAEGLEHIHRNPHVLHANIKPSNVLVDADGNVKLGDVGVAFFQTITRSVEIHGKPGDLRWTAPEVLEGDVYSGASDVYAFGCITLRRYVEENCLLAGTMLPGFTRPGGFVGTRALPGDPQCVRYSAR